MSTNTVLTHDQRAALAQMARDDASRIGERLAAATDDQELDTALQLAELHARAWRAAHDGTLDLDDHMRHVLADERAELAEFIAEELDHLDHLAAGDTESAHISTSIDDSVAITTQSVSSAATHALALDLLLGD